MYVSHLSLHDFRNHELVDVELAPGPTAFVGRNGQGKTNLVEAIGYVATLGSHRVANDAPLIRVGAERAVVRARVVRGERASTVELEITAGRANRARVNRGQLGSPRDALGILRTVLFAPEDLALVKGDPDGRRRFLDLLAVQLLPRMAGLLSDYERVIRQRSALLKSLRVAGRGADLTTLDVWNAKAANLGGQILALRLQLVRALGPELLAAYTQVSDANGDAELTYRSSINHLLPFSPPFTSFRASVSESRNLDQTVATAPSAELLESALLAGMTEARAKEIDRGVSLIGPHRDDLLLTLSGLPAKGYASHGESWSFALALRLASYRLLGGGDGLPANDLLRHSARSEAESQNPEVAVTSGSGDSTGSAPCAQDDGGGEVAKQAEAEVNDSDLFWNPDHGTDADPVLILDDVFAELDTRRRERLAELVAPARQVIITAAVPEDVPPALMATRFDVAAGQVTRA